MFVWITLPGIQDTADMVYSKAVDAKVILVPGFEFYPNPRVSNCVRAAYSMATAEEIDLGLERLAALIREIQRER